MNDQAVSAARGRTAAPGAAAPPGAVLRLRPVVQASQVTGGLRVSGPRSGFTVGGGPQMWRRWRALAEALAEGAPAERLRRLSAELELDPLLARLAEHDMLVEVPASWGMRGDQAGPPGRIARWLEAAAPDPVSAWQALRAGPLTVHGTGRVAAAAFRALRAAGLQATAFATADGLARAVPTAPAGGPPAGRAEAGVVAAGQVAVAAMAGREVAVVTPARRPEAVCAELGGIADRVGLDGTGRVPHVLAALAGGAAAHRLICAVAGLPDPGRIPAQAGLASVLVARLDPLRACYHPWPGPAREAAAEPPGQPAGPPGPADKHPALAVLSDAGLGAVPPVVPPVVLAELPGLPVVLARCQAVIAVGGDAGAARLAAVAGWCGHALEAAIPDLAPVAVAASRPQADGILLRRLADRRARTRGPGRGAEVAEAEWAGSARARLWWKAITLRFAACATMRVTCLAEGVFHAAVDVGTGRLGWAVEPTAPDAAAFAALTAVAALECRDQPAPVLVPAYGAQGEFARVLRGLLGGQRTTVLEPSACPEAADEIAGAGTAGAADLIRTLNAAGFVAVTTAAPVPAMAVATAVTAMTARP